MRCDCDVSRCGLHSALHSSLYARPSLRASVTAPFRTSLHLTGSRLRRLYLMELRSTRKPRRRLRKSGEFPLRVAERQ